MSSGTEVCIFCGRSPLNKTHAQGFSGDFCNCPFCGKYILEHQAEELIELNHAKQKYLIAGFLHYYEGTENKHGDTPVIDKENYKSFLYNEIIPRTIMEKLNGVLLHFYKLGDSLGTYYRFSDFSSQPELFFARNKSEFDAMLLELHQMGRIHIEKNRDGNSSSIVDKFSLSTSGIEKCEELLSGNKNSHKVFVAMGFKDDLIDAHHKAIKPACKKCGFDAFLVSEHEHNEDINDKIIAEINSSRFVIADLTYNNNGAYFEAGYAQGRGCEVLRLCKKSWFEELGENGEKKNDLHFDINHYNFIIWENHEDLEKKLINRINARILG